MKVFRVLSTAFVRILLFATCHTSARDHVTYSWYQNINKNSAIANRSPASCARNTSRASITLWPWNLGYGSLKVIGNGTIGYIIHDLPSGELFDVAYYRDLEMWVRGHKVIQTVEPTSFSYILDCKSLLTMQRYSQTAGDWQAELLLGTKPKTFFIAKHFSVRYTQTSVCLSADLTYADTSRPSSPQQRNHRRRNHAFSVVFQSAIPLTSRSPGPQLHGRFRSQIAYRQCRSRDARNLIYRVAHRVAHFSTAHIFKTYKTRGVSAIAELLVYIYGRNLKAAHDIFETNWKL